MLITTKDNIKTLLKITSTDEDAILVAIAAAVSKEVERYIDRHVEQSQRTAYFDVEEGQEVFCVAGYPISAIASIHNDTDRDWGTGTEVDSDNYTYVRESGQIVIDKIGLLTGFQVLKIVYTGGMSDTQANLQSAFPDLEMAARIQGAHYFKKKDRLGIGAESVAGSSITVDNRLEMLPEVKTVLDQYKRYAIR